MSYNLQVYREKAYLKDKGKLKGYLLGLCLNLQSTWRPRAMNKWGKTIRETTAKLKIPFWDILLKKRRRGGHEIILNGDKEEEKKKKN